MSSQKQFKVILLNDISLFPPTVFPIFNVVQFDNSACGSTDAIASAASTGDTARCAYFVHLNKQYYIIQNVFFSLLRTGVCYTKKECEDKRGLVSGTCAQG